MPDPVELLPFGGLASLEEDQLVPADRALEALNCVLDRRSIRGRNGYRAAHASAIAAAGTTKFVARYRHSPTAARTIVGIYNETGADTNVAVRNVQDPSSETAADGTVSSATNVDFGTTPNISAAQLGQFLYIGTDQASKAMRRMKTDFTLESLQDIPQGAKPTLGAFSALSFTLFNSLAAPTVSGCVTRTSGAGFTNLGTNWVGFSATAATDDHPAQGSTAQYIFGANFDASNHDWLLIAMSPHTGAGINTARAIQIEVAEQSGGVPATWFNVGQIHDIPPISGSPNLIYCDLRGLASGDRDALRYIRFNVVGTSGGQWAIYGYVFLPAKPLANPQTYYVTCQDSSTLQESKPTEGLIVTIKDTDKLNGGALTYVNCYFDNDNPRNTGGSDDILSSANLRIFNRPTTNWAGRPMPTLADIGALVNITVTLHASWVAGQVLRLWKDTSQGRRLVLEYTLTSGDISAGTKVLTDPGGSGVLANVKFRPGGTAPRMNAMAARAGRLILGYENKVYVSRFTPQGATSNPFPQFPDVALEAADGWSFDLAPANTEQIQAIVGEPADATYILTNQNCFVLNDLDAPLLRTPDFFKVSDHGVVSRQGVIWANNTLFWAGATGLWAAGNRVGADEVTASLRRIYKDWLLPDNTLVLQYDENADTILITRGTRQLRWYIPHGEAGWTRHNISHTFLFSTRWHEPFATLTKPQIWFLDSARFLDRWQEDATTDRGTAIPALEYSTGFLFATQPWLVRKVFVECNEQVEVFQHSTATDSDEKFSKTFRDQQSMESLVGDVSKFMWRLRVSGRSTAVVRRLGWQPVGIEREGP